MRARAADAASGCNTLGSKPYARIGLGGRPYEHSEATAQICDLLAAVEIARGASAAQDAQEIFEFGGFD